MAKTDSELIKIEYDLLDNLVPGTFVVFEVLHGRKLLGTFREWTTEYGHLAFVLELPNGAIVREPGSSIVQAWFAPMGYRL